MQHEFFTKLEQAQVKDIDERKLKKQEEIAQNIQKFVEDWGLQPTTCDEQWVEVIDPDTTHPMNTIRFRRSMGDTWVVAMRCDECGAWLPVMPQLTIDGGDFEELGQIVNLCREKRNHICRVSGKEQSKADNLYDAVYEVVADILDQAYQDRRAD